MGPELLKRVLNFVAFLNFGFSKKSCTNSFDKISQLFLTLELINIRAADGVFDLYIICTCKLERQSSSYEDFNAI